MSPSAINTHAGDDSDGKLWGIEGISILFLLAGLLLGLFCAQDARHGLFNSLARWEGQRILPWIP